ncbi:MAG: hypothetical protein GX458_15530 [Phyllobacteriaceae bacterium]|nr:hypothetical protein [Phyllobacteriaceae bacterium]
MTEMVRHGPARTVPPATVGDLDHDDPSGLKRLDCLRLTDRWGLALRHGDDAEFAERSPVSASATSAAISRIITIADRRQRHSKDLKRHREKLSITGVLHHTSSVLADLDFNEICFLWSQRYSAQPHPPLSDHSIRDCCV